MINYIQVRRNEKNSGGAGSYQKKLVKLVSSLRRSFNRNGVKYPVG